MRSKLTRQRRPGFTLIELLVVIAIIGILVALLLPAVQAAREASRRTKCLNNVKQLAMACLLHEDIHGHLPTNGRNWRWSADPNFGFGSEQPGGWHFNVLPYMEQQGLHDLGMGLTGSELEDAGRERILTVVPAFVCPSRGGKEPFFHSFREC